MPEKITVYDIFPPERIKMVSKEILGIKEYPTRKARVLALGWRLVLGLFLIICLSTGFAPIRFLKSSIISAIYGGELKTVNFYPSSFRRDNSFPEERSFINPQNILGVPEVPEDSESNLFSGSNSTVYRGGLSSLIYENFTTERNVSFDAASLDTLGTQQDKKVVDVVNVLKDEDSSATLSEESEASNTTGTVSSIEPTTTSMEQIATSTEETATSTEEATTTEDANIVNVLKDVEDMEGEAGEVQQSAEFPSEDGETEPADSGPLGRIKSFFDMRAEAQSGVKTFKSAVIKFSLSVKEEPSEGAGTGDKTGGGLEASTTDIENATSVENNITFWERVKGWLDASQALAEEEEVINVRNDGTSGQSPAPDGAGQTPAPTIDWGKKEIIEGPSAAVPPAGGGLENEEEDVNNEEGLNDVNGVGDEGVTSTGEIINSPPAGGENIGASSTEPVETALQDSSSPETGQQEESLINEVENIQDSSSTASSSAGNTERSEETVSGMPEMTIWCSFDNELWIKLGTISDYSLSNFSGKEYLTFEAPFIHSWGDIKDLKLKIEGVTSEKTESSIYIDSVWLEAQYIEKQDEEVKEKGVLEFVSGKEYFQSKESPAFRFRYMRAKNIIRRLGEIILQNSTDEYQGLDITASVAGTKIYPQILYEKDGEFIVNFPNLPSDLRPGRHKLIIEIRDGDEVLIQSQDFWWGVLAVNTNKSFYRPGEEAYLQMAVLDDMGHTVCDAHLQLTIKNRSSGETTVFSTAERTIRYSDSCGPDNITHLPDYFTYYEISKTGSYDLELVNLDNGYKISDSFEVREALSFDVERIGPTRIYPPADYEMEIKITSNQDFAGEIIEKVPAGFDITETDQTQIGAQSGTDISVNHLGSTFIAIEEETKKIIWDVELTQGDELELRYTFDAPDVSPYLYLLGPLTIKADKTQIGTQSNADISVNPPIDLRDSASKNEVFRETRAWQIASDSPDLATIRPNGDSGANWNASGTSDNSCGGGTHCDYVDEAVTEPAAGDGIYVYTSLDNATETFAFGTISGAATTTAVDVYLYSYSADTSLKDIDVTLRWDGADQFTQTATPGNGIFAWASTTFSGFSLTQSQLDTLEIKLKGNRKSGSQDTIEVRVDALYVVVNYQPEPSGVTISGTVYTDEGQTDIGAGKTVRIKVEGAGDYSDITDSNGGYSIAYVDATTSGRVLTVFLDGGAEKAVAITHSSGSEITGLNLYQNRVIVRNEDANPITITDMAVYDFSDDADITFSATTTGGTATGTTVFTGNSLFVWNNMTFEPGGEVTVMGNASSSPDGDIRLASGSVFNAGGDITLAGSWLASSSASLSAGNFDVTFNATTSGKSIYAQNQEFYNLIFNGSGGEWEVMTQATAAGDLTVTAGSLSGSSNMAVLGGDVTGNGNLDWTGGIFNMEGTGNFGGDSTWSFYNLTFGDSSTSATSSKTGAGNVEIKNTLSIAENHFLEAGSEIWTLSSSSLPFIMNGSFDAQNSIFKYVSSDNTAVTAATYYRLELAPGASSPTYTIQSGTLTTNDYLYCGDGTHGLTVNADNSDPTLNIAGDFEIRNSAVFIASASAGFSVGGDWVNQGTFNHSGGTVMFDAADSGHTVNPGNSDFGNVDFNNASGSWTLTANATSAGNFSLTSAAGFTATSSVTLEVQGQFTNLVGGTATTWTGSTLYLNSGTTYTVNSSGTNDVYPTLKIGADTDISVWNSSAVSYQVDSSGSLYSMDHGGLDGYVYIWGDYHIVSGTTEYWSYATDFDGTDISASPRQCNVRVRSSNKVTLDGGILNIIGTASHTTVIDRNTAPGYYSFEIISGTFNADYYVIRKISSEGLNFSGPASVTSLNHGDFYLEIEEGSMITIATSTVARNAGLVITGCKFATSSIVDVGQNVTAGGASYPYWRFTGHFGGFDGEAHDADAGDPGNIRWDNSLPVLNVAGKVYSDQGLTYIDTAPIISLAINSSFYASTTASVVDGSYSFADVICSGGNTITVYIDEDVYKGAAVTLTNVSTINDMDIYADSIIVRDDNDQTGLSIADMAYWDRDDDTDIQFTAVAGSPDALTLYDGAELYVWHTSDGVFVPNGSVNVKNMEIRGTYTASGAEIITVSGSWYTSGPNAFHAASSTVLFNSTTTGNIITSGGSLFYLLEFDGAGGEWILQDSATATATTTITAGTFSQGTNNDLVLGSLTIETGGSFEKDEGGGILIFEASDPVFIKDATESHNLGDVQIGFSPATTTQNSDIIVDSLTINAGDVHQTAGYEIDCGGDIIVYGTLDASDGGELDGTIINLAGSWLVSTTTSGVFNAADSEVIFDATTTGKTIVSGNSSFYDLTFAGISGGWILNSGNHDVNNDLSIFSGTVTSTVGTIYVGGSWSNAGSFHSNSGTVVFDSAAAGETIDAGDSSFNIVTFDNSNGGWVVISDATSTGDWNLVAASSFAASSSVTIEVQGEFSNQLASSTTTWNSGSILYLNSASSYSANASTTGDNYQILIVGPATHVSLWNSSALFYQVDSSGSLYSQDHNNSDGSLYVWGDYRIHSGQTGYWNYATDFDGTDISGSPRQCDVRFATTTFTTTTVESGGMLQLLGGASATTSLDVQGATGNYALKVTGGTLNARYYRVRNVDDSGLNISGSTDVQDLSYGDFELAVEGGSLITIAPSVIEQATSTFGYLRFATSASAVSGYNVTLTGSPSYNYWEFQDHYGGLDGENYDLEPGSDTPGFLRWEDSPYYSPKSARWRWYHDQFNETPTSSAAAEDSAPNNVAVGNVLKLRLTIKETSGATGDNVKMRIQFSTSSSFSWAEFLAEKGNCTSSAWCYGEGVDEDNATITTNLLSDATSTATHNESGTSATDYDHQPGVAAEWEFTILNNGASTSTTYYFRAYDNTAGSPVPTDIGESYPSLTPGQGMLSFTISGVASGTVTEGITTDFDTSSTSVPFGALGIGQEKEGAQRLIVTTNSENGYQVFIHQTQDLTSGLATIINPIVSTNENPAAWPANPDPGGYGYHAGDDTLSDIGFGSARFAAIDTYAKFETDLKEVAYSSIPINNESTDLVFKAEVTSQQEAGSYESGLIYICVPSF